jgi:hypothetical protein
MPFKSQAQRNLFYAAENDPEVRKRTGISKGVANKFTAHDEGGKLPKHVKKKKHHPGTGILSKSRNR